MTTSIRARGHIGERNGKTKTTYFFSLYCGRHPNTGKKLYWRQGGFGSYEEAEVGLMRAQLELADAQAKGLIPARLLLLTPVSLESVILNGADVGDCESAPYVPPADPTVAEWLKFWNESKVEGLRTTTRRNYRRMVRLYIVPMLGDVKVRALTPMQVQIFVNAMKGRQKSGGGGKISAGYVRLIFSTLSTALTFAVQQTALEKNPCRGVVVPKDQPRRPEDTSAEMVQAILDEARGTRWYALLYLAAYTGMRRGEVLGLTWRAIDLDARQISVERQRTDGEDGTVELPPKSEKSARTLEVGASLVRVLRSHRAVQQEEFIANGLEWTESTHCFTSARGRPYTPKAFTSAFGEIRVRAGYPNTTLHALRHAHASILLDEHRASLPVVSERLGHASVDITARIYSHAAPGGDRRAADRFDDGMRSKVA